MLANSYYKNQRELADALNNLVDSYWAKKIDESELIKNITNIFLNNKDKFKKENEYTKILQQKCGKKRLDVIEKILIKYNSQGES